MCNCCTRFLHASYAAIICCKACNYCSVLHTEPRHYEVAKRQHYSYGDDEMQQTEFAAVRSDVAQWQQRLQLEPGRAASIRALSQQHFFPLEDQIPPEQLPQFPRNFLAANVKRKSLTCYEEISDKLRARHEEVTRKLLPWNLAFTPST